MRRFKPILTLLVILIIVDHAHAQEGFKVIQKAKKKFLHGHNKKALKLLAKAEEMDYGFCGNAWVGANRSVNLLRAQIYIDQNEYELARNSLDSIWWEYPSDNLDSMRILTYQMEYGKDSLSGMIDSSLVKTTLEGQEFDWQAVIPLTNGDTMRLKTHPLFFEGIYTECMEERLKAWLKWFKHSPNYLMCKERTEKDD